MCVCAPLRVCLWDDVCVLAFGGGIVGFAIALVNGLVVDVVVCCSLLSMWLLRLSSLRSPSSWTSTWWLPSLLSLLSVSLLLPLPLDVVGVAVVGCCCWCCDWSRCYPCWSSLVAVCVVVLFVFV